MPLAHGFSIDKGDRVNPLDLPVHPAVVHFPLAMLSAAWVALVGYHGTGRPRWGEWAWTFEVIGVAFLPLTVILGFVDLRGIGQLTSPRWDQPLVWHVLAGLVATLVFAAHVLLRHRKALPAGRAGVVVDLSLVTGAMWLLVFGGMLAGEMVYG